MKRYWVLLIISLTLFTNVSAQINPLTGKPENMSPTEQSGNDSTPSVEIVQPTNGMEVALYIDGKYIPGLIMAALNSHTIAHIQVEKSKVVEGEHEYYGQIFLQMKDNYKPALISLADMKKKYVKKR